MILFIELFESRDHKESNTKIANECGESFQYSNKGNK